MTSVVINQLGKSLSNGLAGDYVDVLESASLKFQSPLVVSIVGPNGVGKTTFLRLLAGLISPDEGSILIDSKTPTQCRIGYVPQSNPVLPWRRIEDDIAIPLEILGLSRKERRSHVVNLIDQFSFDLPLGRRAHALSGGQRQLVNLCRAIVGPEPPRVLLLDEPFASLDLSAQQEFIEYLERVFLQFNFVVFITTHQLDLAVMISDVIVPFRERPVQITQDDVIDISLSRPRSREMRAEPSFQEILGSVEQLFRKKAVRTGVA